MASLGAERRGRRREHGAEPATRRVSVDVTPVLEDLALAEIPKTRMWYWSRAAASTFVAMSRTPSHTLRQRREKRVCASAREIPKRRESNKKYTSSTPNFYRSWRGARTSAELAAEGLPEDGVGSYESRAPWVSRGRASSHHVGGGCE